MNNKDEKVVPLIVNGEINDSRNRKKQQNNNSKLPNKRFTFLDFLLTLVGLGLVGYGIYTLTQDKEKEDKKSNTQEIKQEFSINDLKTYIPTGISETNNLYSNVDLEGMKTGLSTNNLSNNAIISLASRITRPHSKDGKQYFLETDIDDSIKKLFGDIKYTKSQFSFGDFSYTYNQETKRYYSLSSTTSNNTLDRYDYIELEDNKDYVLVKDYVVYNDNNILTLIDGSTLNTSITKDTMKDYTNVIKYLEYKFTKKNDNYILETITIR